MSMCIYYGNATSNNFIDYEYLVLWCLFKNDIEQKYR